MSEVPLYAPQCLQRPAPENNQSADFSRRSYISMVLLTEKLSRGEFLLLLARANLVGLGQLSVPSFQLQKGFEDRNTSPV